MTLLVIHLSDRYNYNLYSILLAYFISKVTKIMYDIILGISQTMINKAGQDWAGKLSLSPASTFQISINKVIMGTKTIVLKTFETMINNLMTNYMDK